MSGGLNDESEKQWIQWGKLVCDKILKYLGTHPARMIMETKSKLSFALPLTLSTTCATANRDRTTDSTKSFQPDFLESFLK